jgi:hypothetical protein
MNTLQFSVSNLPVVLSNYDYLVVFRARERDGSYAELLPRIALVAGQTSYDFSDIDGEWFHWYKTSYYNSSTDSYSQPSQPIQADSGGSAEKVGYTFGNYAVPSGEWGEVLTADDMRYTFLWGVDEVAQDVEGSYWTDAQYRWMVDQAVAQFETFLGIDIRKRVYKTEPEGLTRAKVWREGVDYTHEDDPYDFDPKHWERYGFLQLRHRPVLSVESATLYSVVQSGVIDLSTQGWLRIQKESGQLNFYPRQGQPYGPFEISTYPWSMFSVQYPQGYKIDYTTGFETSDFVPEDLRHVVALWASIAALNSIGDGLLAGFSSSSISLDGMSESFSSTQSATSAYFGARIKAYTDQLQDWLKKNRYKYAIPISFVGV